jgi:RNA polymerase sigma-70 factor (ECF subfamily)
MCSQSTIQRRQKTRGQRLSILRPRGGKSEKIAAGNRQTRRSYRIQRIAARAKNNGVIRFTTNAFVSPAIFLAIEAAETKQANGSPHGSLKMNPPGASQDEIDPAVMRRVAEGDTVAFERVYDAFSGILYSLALRMLERPEDTEELLQEVFLKIWRDAEAYDPRRGVPLAWAITITRHKAIDKIRSTTRRLRLYEAAEAEAKSNSVPLPQPVNNAESTENAQAVRESLGRLAPEVRESIELAFFGGLSHSQIASRLSLPLTTVKSRIRRAMMQLRQSLRHYE